MVERRNDDAPGAVWFRAPQQRRKTPALNRERIVRAAVDRLDRDGTEGLSLRKIAGDLDVHATSLYWHVATKGDVLDLALDEVFAEIALPRENRATGWQDVVLTYMRELRTVLLRHPWAASLASTRPLAGPNALARSEIVYAALAEAGLDGEELAAAAAAVSNLAIATASTQAAWARQPESASRNALHQRIAAERDRYPTLAEHLECHLGDWDSQFEITARTLLTGLDPKNR
ncbi:TetR/AcrR family transcriptional regulator C-terminal domain-containing protein [Saccharopolyspora indica]|uniref:TetR/AcrR family transcriptional regulator C-terminal domain-containing protein n=1 Tax=Saccharopolyspora indica TaxID=1229659 RepID=UPI0022EB2F55|nr:TetR/AcrR family transcriptional regulator C-terminal domain-containing protein [Saccharopolyspora indica]MDA3648952.1 TetR/AcrR family transcriptional regulator C-terminal domain-containing protein [Saccharopolyspora indica]